MASLADEQEYVKAVYWGDFGSGKTTSMAHMAHLGPVKWVRVEKGLKARPLRALGIPIENIDPIDELRPDGLLPMIEKWRGLLHDDPAAIAGTVVDTMTTFVARRVEHYTDQAWRDYVAKCKRQHIEVDRSRRYSVIEDTRDLYQPVTQELSRIIQHMIDLPCHSAFAAQIRTDVDTTSGVTMHSPATNPAVQSVLVGYCDLVIETQPDGQYEDGDEEDVFLGFPKPRLGRAGKDRFGALPRILVNPTFDRVVAYVHGKLDFREDPVQLRYRELLKVRKARQKAEDDEL
jgi:hypothetical protein